MVFQFLYAMDQVFSGYFGEEYDEDAIRNNFTLVYELLDGASPSAVAACLHVHCVTCIVCCIFVLCASLPPTEVLDFGYPQNCALEVLQSYINFGHVRVRAASPVCDVARMSHSVCVCVPNRRTRPVRRR